MVDRTTAAITASKTYRISGTLSDAALLTFAPSKTYQSVVFSSPALESGLQCEVYSGGSCTGTASDGLYAAGTCTGGTVRDSFTINNRVTRVEVD